MILASVHNLTKHYGPAAVLSGATFDLRPGERAGLVGPNGAGKSTLLRMLAGREQPDGGSVAVHSGVRIAYLEQHPEFEPGRTVWDEAASALESLAQLAQQLEATSAAIAEAEDEAERRRLLARYDLLHHQLDEHDAYHLDHRVERVLLGLGFVPSEFGQLVTQLSGGQQNRVLLARILLTSADLLLLDEPSNHLDIAATAWLEDLLAQTTQTLLVVSHDRYLLDRVTNRTLELFAGSVESYAGNFSAYWRQKAERLEFQARAFARQQEYIAKTEDFIRRNLAGQKTKQAKDRVKKLERLERVDRPRQISSPPMGFPPAARAGDVVLRAEHLTKGYGRPLFRDLSFDVLRGERWGILGPNGCGKTTLLKLLVGAEQPDAGRAIVGTGAMIGYFDQLQAGLDPDELVVDAVRPPRRELHEPARRDLLARFGIVGEQAFQRVASLSGGERNRAGLARLAALEANVLVLDEPTNHLDLWARDALEAALQAFDGTLLFVSHDRYFLNRVADRLLVLEPDRVRVVHGGYDDYVYQQRAAEAAANGPARPAGGPAAPAPKQSKPARRKRKFPFRQVADLEAEIARHEARRDELHALLASPAVHRDFARVQEVNGELAAIEQLLPRLYEHWEEAVELN